MTPEIAENRKKWCHMLKSLIAKTTTRACSRRVRGCYRKEAGNRLMPVAGYPNLIGGKDFCKNPCTSQHILDTHK